MRSLGRTLLATTTATFLACASISPGTAAPRPPHQPPPMPQKVELQVINGRCDTTVLQVDPRTYVTVHLKVASNFRGDATFEIPSRGIRVGLPVGWYTTDTYVPVGVLGRVALPFWVNTPPWVGSSGDGCRGIIQAG